MNTQTRNEIALWLLDRVKQGMDEEVGSIDWNEYEVDGQTIRITIMRDEGNQFPVWMDEYMAADFILTNRSSERTIRKRIDEWYKSAIS